MHIRVILQEIISLRYLAGDTLGMIPRNNPGLVTALLEQNEVGSRNRGHT